MTFFANRHIHSCININYHPSSAFQQQAMKRLHDRQCCAHTAISFITSVVFRAALCWRSGFLSCLVQKHWQHMQPGTVIFQHRNSLIKCLEKAESYISVVSCSNHMEALILWHHLHSGIWLSETSLRPFDSNAKSLPLSLFFFFWLHLPCNCFLELKPWVYAVKGASTFPGFPEIWFN